MIEIVGPAGFRFLRRKSPEAGRADDLDHLEVLRVPELAVADARRLVEAAAGFHHDPAEAFVLEQHPALQHVDELQPAIVPVPLAVRRLAGAGADHVGHHLAAGRAPDAEVAVLETASPPALPGSGFFEVRNAKGGALHTTGF